MATTVVRFGEGHGLAEAPVNNGNGSGNKFTLDRDATVTHLHVKVNGTGSTYLRISRLSDGVLLTEATNNPAAIGWNVFACVNVALLAGVEYVLWEWSDSDSLYVNKSDVHAHTVSGLTATYRGGVSEAVASTERPDTAAPFEMLLGFTAIHNSDPSVPTSLTPSGATGLNTLTLSAVVSDPDGDSVLAEFQTATDAAFTAGLVTHTGSTVASGNTSSKSVTLTANTTYHLRARTKDAGGRVSAYTASQTFTTNRPPTMGAVTAPNGGEVYNTVHTVSWTAGSDPDGQPLTYDVDLTTDGGTTWSNLKTSFTGTSFSHDFTNVGASTACRVRVRAKDTLGAVSAYDESDANFTIQHNRAPTAPLLGKPENGSTADLAAGYTFTYTATDPDSGDAPSAWAFRRKIAGAAAYEFWNASTAAWQATIQWNPNPSGQVAFASAKWTNGNTYNWSVATKDTQGLEGPFAADFSVTAATVATATVTAPSGSVTNTSRPLVRWTLTQPEGKPQQTYQTRVFTEAVAAAAGFDPATTAATWETVEIASAGAREHQVGVDLANSTGYRAYVRLKAADLYTAWAHSAFSMALTPPPAATAVVTDEPNSPFGPRVRVDVDLTFDLTFTQANTTISVERSDDAGLTWTLVRDGERMPLTVDGSAALLDYEPPRGVPVQYRAFSVADL